MKNFPPLKAIITCVDYGDILALTLPYNRHHFEKVVVVTTPGDRETIELAEANNCLVHATSDFYKDGAVFNKWSPLEQGLDLLGRSGWIAIMDADIAWPKVIPDQKLFEHTMYSPRRYVNPQLTLPPENVWAGFQVHPVGHIWAGYTQVFHADHAGPEPWHMEHHNAGGPDTVFQNRWASRQRFSWRVLHIGPTETNWNGRITPKIDGTRFNRTVDLERMMQEHRYSFKKFGG